MDQTQTNHLNAYGIAYWALKQNPAGIQYQSAHTNCCCAENKKDVFKERIHY